MCVTSLPSLHKVTVLVSKRRHGSTRRSDTFGDLSHGYSAAFLQLSDDKIIFVRMIDDGYEQTG